MRPLGPKEPGGPERAQARRPFRRIPASALDPGQARRRAAEAGKIESGLKDLTRMPAQRRATRRRTRIVRGRRWSRGVTERSNALDLEPGVFTKDPAGIARSLKRSAERSTRKKSSSFRSAMSMLSFYQNRAGRKLPASRRRALERAKAELRRLYGRT